MADKEEVISKVARRREGVQGSGGGGAREVAMAVGLCCRRDKAAAEPVRGSDSGHLSSSAGADQAGI